MALHLYICIGFKRVKPASMLAEYCKYLLAIEDIIAKIVIISNYTVYRQCHNVLI